VILQWIEFILLSHDKMSLKCIHVVVVATCVLHIALKVLRVIKLVYIACKLKVIVVIADLLGCPSKCTQLL